AYYVYSQDGDEYTGPSSGISLLSDTGLDWIRKAFNGSQDMCNVLKSVNMDVASHLQMPKCIPANPWASNAWDVSPKPFPPHEVMWEYVDAYFRTVQCIFPVLHRPVFEERLSNYLRDYYPFDPAWSALLNAVLASGCRAMLSSETPTAFERSSQEAWGYFLNAINLIAQMVYKPTSVAVVQALAVMTVYAQGLSSPQRLEYNFCTLAVHVAQGLGMHRQPLASWNLPDHEIQERNRLFWTIYTLDKTISLRSGRPSAIDDDEISCIFPQGVITVQDGAPVCQGWGVECEVFDFFLIAARYARICGNIARQLYSASALHHPSEDLLPIAEELENDLDRWRAGIPEAFRPGGDFRPSKLPSGFPFIQVLVLHFGYHDAVCAISRRFSSMFVHYEQQPLPEPAVRVMRMKCMAASRSTILLIKHLDIESYYPGWMLFYYPTTALIALFIGVVSYPEVDSANNDIALMHVVIGHLGRLEFITAGGTAFNKIGELVRLARKIVQENRTSVFPGGFQVSHATYNSDTDAKLELPFQSPEAVC
ncbi:hypothetical protein K432DRAFT_310261, partial [Lepidopterella palustris CBS 459.81]